MAIPPFDQFYLRVPSPSTGHPVWCDILVVDGAPSSTPDIYPYSRLRLLTDTGWKVQTTQAGQPLYLRMPDGTWRWVANLQAGIPALDVVVSEYQMSGTHGNLNDNTVALLGPISQATEWHELHDDLIYDTYYLAGRDTTGQQLDAGCSSFLLVLHETDPVVDIEFDWHGPHHQSVLVLDTNMLPVTPKGYLRNPANGSWVTVDMLAFPPSSADPSATVPWSSVDIDFTYTAFAGAAVDAGAAMYYPDAGPEESYAAQLASIKFYLTRLDIGSLVQPTNEIVTGPARTVQEAQFVGRVTSRFAQGYLGGDQGTDILTFTAAGANGALGYQGTYTHHLTPDDVNADNGLVAFGLFSDLQRQGGRLPNPLHVGTNNYGFIHGRVSWSMRAHYANIP